MQEYARISLRSWKLVSLPFCAFFFRHRVDVVKEVSVISSFCCNPRIKWEKKFDLNTKKTATCNCMKQFYITRFSTGDVQRKCSNGRKKVGRVRERWKLNHQSLKRAGKNRGHHNCVFRELLTNFFLCLLWHVATRQVGMSCVTIWCLQHSTKHELNHQVWLNKPSHHLS